MCFSKPLIVFSDISIASGRIDDTCGIDEHEKLDEIEIGTIEEKSFELTSSEIAGTITSGPIDHSRAIDEHEKVDDIGDLEEKSLDLTSSGSAGAPVLDKSTIISSAATIGERNSGNVNVVPVASEPKLLAPIFLKKKSNVPKMFDTILPGDCICSLCADTEFFELYARVAYISILKSPARLLFLMLRLRIAPVKLNLTFSAMNILESMLCYSYK